jgi:uncharacterized protein YciI
VARYVVIFEDRPDALWVREQHDQEHFDYLARNSARIPLGGGLRADHDQPLSGGLWVLEVATKDEVTALVENDPYFRMGLRAKYEVFAWGKAPGYGAVVL